MVFTPAVVVTPVPTSTVPTAPQTATLSLDKLSAGQPLTVRAGTGDGTIGNPQMQILAASPGLDGAAFTTSWRQRTADEKRPSSKLPFGCSQLCSDVLNLSGLPSGPGNELVLQMAYDASLAGSPERELTELESGSCTWPT